MVSISPSGSKDSCPVSVHRKLRACNVGAQLCKIGIPAGITAGLIEGLWGSTVIAIANSSIAAACALSLYLSRGPERENRFVWWPAYLMFWIAFFPNVYATGGIVSPYLGIYLTALLLIGLMVQTRFSSRVIFVATAFTFLMGTLPGFFRHHPSGSIVAYLMAFSKVGFLLLGIFGCVISFIQTERKLEKDSHNQNERLSETQGQLTQTAKMAEIGYLIAGTAHELTQPIQVIGAASSLIGKLMEQTEGNQQETIRQLVTRTQEAAHRAVRLLRQLRDFSRNDSFTPEVLDLRETIHAVQVFTQFELQSSKVFFEILTPAEPLWVFGDSLRIQQVLLNLINNAKDACLGSAIPSVRLECEAFRNWVRFTVSNNGPGIPLSLQSRILKTPVTTKKRGKGTGLGLTICMQLIEQHHGRMLFSSMPEETTFVVDFPKTSSPKRQALTVLDRMSS